jgi:hypothetical protein
VDSSSNGGSRRGLLLVLLLVVVALVIGGLVYWRSNDEGSAKQASPTPSPTRVVVSKVASFSASRGTTTKSFKADTNWQLRWSAPVGSGFTVELLTPEGTSLGTIVSGGKRASGSTFVSQAGTFKLKVVSRSPWSATVLSRPVK